MTNVFVDPPYKPVERDVAQHLADRVVGSAPNPGEIQASVNLIYGDPPVAGQNVFTGPERKPSDNQSLLGAIPDTACVFVLGTGGFADIPYKPGQGGADDSLPEPQDWPGIRQPTVQILIRSSRFDYDGGKILSDAVQAAIDKSPPSGYLESRAAVPPSYIREDDENHHIWTLNVQLQFECL